MFILVCCISDIVITNVKHIINVVSGICLNSFLEIFKHIFGTNN